MKLLQLLLASISALFAPAVVEHKMEQVAPAPIVVLVGTDRPDSQTNATAEKLMQAYAKQGLSAQLYHVTDFGPEFYAPSVYEKRPSEFQKFNDAVLVSDVVVLVTPEYNATIPAPLTRVINLLSFPDSFKDKKFSIVSVSVSPYGATRAHEQLKKTLVDLHAIVNDDANLKVAHVDQVTKQVDAFGEHAENIARFIQG
jgi:NAD(P)H-dependent FMN reductase